MHRVFSVSMMGLAVCAVRVLPLLFLSLNAFSASFDCKRATSKVDKLICGSPQLGKLDVDLAEIYKEASQKDASIRQEQVAWLRQRNQCGDVKCLESAYEERIDELTNFIVRFDRQALAGSQEREPAAAHACDGNLLARGCPLSFLASEGLFWTEGKVAHQTCASLIKKNADQSFFSFGASSFTVLIPGAKFQKEFSVRYELISQTPALRFQVIKKVGQATITTPYQFDKSRKALVQTRKSDCLNCSKAQQMANDQGLENLVECSI